MRLAEQHGPAVEVDGHEPPAARVVREAVAGGSADFLDALADRLAIGVASVVAILDPGCLVLGGEVGRAAGRTSRHGWRGGSAVCHLWSRR